MELQTRTKSSATRHQSIPNTGDYPILIVIIPTRWIDNGGRKHVRRRGMLNELVPDGDTIGVVLVRMLRRRRVERRYYVLEARVPRELLVQFSTPAE
ncbi:hypothetical protein MIMGU_mgv1a017031mg [Erythranthe guttata]|uniref:Uncharacterized protein n=1 Tax=Erythranthe guttata TaxID=4155 RepID=A0A022Q987_ERYGU|nr:hypothetical protein MIMGU_mgv1a017031mg [Erythranthe guttata]